MRKFVLTSGVDYFTTTMSENKGASPWSSFHSSLALSVKAPGSPVRHHEFPPRSEPTEGATAAASVVGELLKQFSDLDLLMEYKLLCLNCTGGVYVIPSAKTLHEWHGVYFVHSGPYRDGVFKFSVFIPDEFPQTRPIIRFSTRIYHPYVHTHNGIVNVSRIFPQWDPSKHHIWHFIHHTKECFYNKETWQEVDAETFLGQAHHCALESLHALYEDNDEGENNMIKFSELSEESFLQTKATLIQGGLPKAPPALPTQGMLSSVTEQFKNLWDRFTS